MICCQKLLALEIDLQKLQGGDKSAASVHLAHVVLLVNLSSGALASNMFSGQFNLVPLDGRGGSEPEPERFGVAGKRGSARESAAVQNVLTDGRVGHVRGRTSCRS